MKIVGIDSSTSSTGRGIIIDGRPIEADVYRPPRWKKAPRTDIDRVDRLDDIATEVYLFAKGADLVVVEDLPPGVHDNRKQLAGLNWLIRRELWSHGLPFVLVPPKTLKAFAGVGGAATKAQMIQAAQEAFRIEVEDDNAADALWLAEVGAARLGCPVLSESADRLRLLRGVLWPTSDLAA